ncbi:MAG: YggS family pyridoxal phosphate-dependent enzyme [Deltaproteobacteria bacterium]|nr:YggS family pyridoxal phosphate-dependent enzyme [Deltaproteobacteria bacterium]
MDDTQKRYTQVLGAVADAVRAAGSTAKPVRLIAVSKMHGAAAVRDLYALGQRQFGENYVQELVSKAHELNDLADLRWIFIGRLQTNKMAQLVKVAAEIQSVGNERHARLLAKAAREHAPRLPIAVHILVNAGDESSKDGANSEEALRLASIIATELPELDLRGIMAIPPPLPPDAPEAPPEIYRDLRRLADQIGARELSLGMTADLRQAVSAGSDCVRIGTALFGPRRKGA